MSKAMLFALLWACCSVVARSQSAIELSPSATKESAAEHLSVDELVQLALAKNPEVKSLQLKVEALRHRLPQANALPDPSLAVGWAGNLTPFSVMKGDPSSARTLAISQQIPYPGKRTLQVELASKDVQAAQADVDMARKRIAVEARVAYYDYAFAASALEAQKRSQNILEEIAKVADQQYRSGNGMQTDLLRAQLQITLAMEKVIGRERQLSEAKARINALLQNRPEADLLLPEELKPAPLPEESEIYQRAMNNDVEAKARQVDIERGKVAVSIAERQNRPDLTVGYMLQQRSQQDTMNGLTFSVNIPLFTRTKQREAVVEAATMQASATKAHEARLNQLRLDVRQQLIAAQSSHRIIALYQDGILAQAKLAIESSIVAFRTNKTDMQSVLANEIALIDSQIEYARAVSEEQSAIARLEALTANADAMIPAQTQSKKKEGK